MFRAPMATRIREMEDKDTRNRATRPPTYMYDELQYGPQR
jgi:hypothetical protein